jgi:hypothetical protein
VLHSIKCLKTKPIWDFAELWFSTLGLWTGVLSKKQRFANGQLPGAPPFTFLIFLYLHNYLPHLASSCLILPLEFFQEIAQFQEIFSGFVAGFARDLKQIRNLAHVIELTILMHASKHSCKSFFPAIAEF